MMKKCRYLLVACMLALLGACASGPKYNEVQSAIPTIPADQGRIYVYRSASMLGGAIQPSVMLNGEKVGDSKPGGFSFVDRAPGNFEVLTSSEVDKKLTFTLERGQTQYVKTTVGLGLIVYRVYPELMDPKQGEIDIQDLSYTGPVLPNFKK